MAIRAFPVLDVPPEKELHVKVEPCEGSQRSHATRACYYEHVWRRMAEGMRKSAMHAEDMLRREKAGLAPSASVIAMYENDKSKLDENAVGCDERAQAWFEEAERILKFAR